MPHAGIPLDGQWERWSGVTYALPVQCWLGPHHSAVITGIARAGIDVLTSSPAGRRRAAGGPICSTRTPRSRMPSGGPTRSSIPGAPIAAP